MNYCTKCASYYQVAGTCNCFARPGITVQPQPYVWPLVPTVVPWPMPVIPTSPTITWGNVAGAGEMLLPPVVNNTAAAACAAPFIGTVRTIIV